MYCKLFKPFPIARHLKKASKIFLLLNNNFFLHLKLFNVVIHVMVVRNVLQTKHSN